MSRRLNKGRPKREMCWDGGWDDDYSHNHSNLGIEVVEINLPWWRNIF